MTGIDWPEVLQQVFVILGAASAVRYVLIWTKQEPGDINVLFFASAFLGCVSWVADAMGAFVVLIVLGSLFVAVLGAIVYVWEQRTSSWLLFFVMMGAFFLVVFGVVIDIYKLPA